jgi:tRNA-Thr(GGU) m(6)t(6)A37 methyltransferase TsaA
MEAPFTFRPIGHVRSGKDLRFKARHQPDEKDAESSVLELEPWPGMRESVRDLEGMERIWIVWVFHRAESWRPLVLPPRGPAQRRGVLSTRSPHRPNPIGITPVRLLHVDKLRLHLGPCDLLEGTPVLDIKPYVPSYDSFPEASAGWIDAVDALSREAPAFRVAFAPLAREQLDWLRGRWAVDFEPRLVELLSRDPSPHRTRRIRTRRDGPFEIGCGTWKALFSVSGSEVTVGSIEPSYPVRFLTEAWRTGIPDHDAMLDFLTRWPCPALEPRDP